MEIRDKLFEYLSQINHFKGNSQLLTDDYKLMDSGVITSIEIINLVEFLESTFEISVSVSEATAENFQSINTLKSFIERKKN